MSTYSIHGNGLAACSSVDHCKVSRIRATAAVREIRSSIRRLETMLSNFGGDPVVGSSNGAGPASEQGCRGNAAGSSPSPRGGAR